LITGCGGGDSNPPVVGSSSSSATSVSSSNSVSSSSSSSASNTWEEGVYAPSENFFNLCENPRTGIAPSNDQPYPDEQGSWLDENNYLRSISNDVYLWYDEIVDRNPALYANTQTYFNLLKTTQLSPTGEDKDRFHWYEDTETYRERTQS